MRDEQLEGVTSINQLMRRCGFVNLAFGRRVSLNPTNKAHREKLWKFAKYPRWCAERNLPVI